VILFIIPGERERRGEKKPSLQASRYVLAVKHALQKDPLLPLPYARLVKRILQRYLSCAFQLSTFLTRHGASTSPWSNEKVGEPTFLSRTNPYLVYGLHLSLEIFTSKTYLDLHE
jgi:hypothetical protein